MVVVLCLLVSTALLYLGFHTWAHLPALREAGFMPEPSAQDAAALNASITTTSAFHANSSSIANTTGCLQEQSRISLVLAIGDLLLKWLTPRRIDIIQRCTYTCFFLASAFEVWLFLCVSCAIRHRMDSQVVSGKTLRDDDRWWWVPCHQAIMHLSCVAMLNLAAYTLRAPFMRPWYGLDAVLYGLQVWYVLLMIGFQWCALGGLKWHQPILDRLTASPGNFFLEEIINAGSNFCAVFLMFVWLLMPMAVAHLRPDLQLLKKQPQLPTGCRLSWQADAHSWYSCSLLANNMTHKQFLIALACQGSGALGTVVWAVACYCTATAGEATPQQLTLYGWAKHALWALWQGLSSLFWIALGVVLRQARLSHNGEGATEQAGCEDQHVTLQVANDGVMQRDKALQCIGNVVQLLRAIEPADLQVQAAIRVLQQCLGQQQQRTAGQQKEDGQLEGMAEGTSPANTAFAKHWWWHIAAAYTGMCFHGGYCMLIIMLQGLQIDPFAPHFEVFVHGLAAVLWLVRFYHGIKAWRTVEGVPDPKKSD
jgi:hypothetical protein